jgi:hypothetical protein
VNLKVLEETDTHYQQSVLLQCQPKHSYPDLIQFCTAHPIILNYCRSFKFYSCILCIIFCELMLATDKHIVFSDTVTIFAYVVSNEWITSE